MSLAFELNYSIVSITVVWEKFGFGQLLAFEGASWLWGKKGRFKGFYVLRFTVCESLQTIL